jgi:drug/metabolite transporter (DMT)-like permease
LSPYLWMLSGSLAFASMATLAHGLAGSCDWQVIALARAGLPLVLAAVFGLRAGVRLVVWGPPTLWMRSIAGSLSLVGTFYALTRLPVADVFTLTNMFPIWVALLSRPLLGEPPPGHVWVSVACGVVGVALIQQPHLAEGNFASLVALAGSFCTALAMIGLHRLRGMDPWAIVTHFSGVALLMCLAALFLFDRAATAPAGLNAWVVLTLLGIGLAATVGQLFLTKAFAAGPPAKVSIIGLTQIVFALALGVWLLQQPFHPSTLVGVALVIAPTAWVMALRA